VVATDVVWLFQKFVSLLYLDAEILPEITSLSPVSDFIANISCQENRKMSVLKIVFQLFPENPPKKETDAYSVQSDEGSNTTNDATTSDLYSATPSDACAIFENDVGSSSYQPAPKRFKRVYERKEKQLHLKVLGRFHGIVSSVSRTVMVKCMRLIDSKWRVLSADDV